MLKLQLRLPLCQRTFFFAFSSPQCRRFCSFKKRSTGAARHRQRASEIAIIARRHACSHAASVLMSRHAAPPARDEVRASANAGAGMSTKQKCEGTNKAKAAAGRTSPTSAAAVLRRLPPSSSACLAREPHSSPDIVSFFALPRGAPRRVESADATEPSATHTRAAGCGVAVVGSRPAAADSGARFARRHGRAIDLLQCVRNAHHTAARPDPAGAFRAAMLLVSPSGRALLFLARRVSSRFFSPRVDTSSVEVSSRSAAPAPPSAMF